MNDRPIFKISDSKTANPKDMKPFSVETANGNVYKLKAANWQSAESIVSSLTDSPIMLIDSTKVD